MTRPAFDAAVYVGRFQPLHDAHLAVMQQALQVAPRLLVVLGSAGAARSPRNPFTAGEREGIITGALTDAGVDAGRVRFAGVPDEYDTPRWARRVRGAAAEHFPDASSVALVGHHKDESSAYLRSFPQWTFVPATVRSPLSATDVREVYYRERAVPPGVPDATARFLTDFARTPDFEWLRAEAAWEDGYRAALEGAAGVARPEVLALVTSGDRLLAVRRPSWPGLGLLGLPGGPPGSGPLAQACAAQVRTITGVDLPGAPDAARIFDHPARRPEQRVIAHVFTWSLPQAPSPEGPAVWVPLQAVHEQPESFFGDHAFIARTLTGS